MSGNYSCRYRCAAYFKKTKNRQKQLKSATKSINEYNMPAGQAHTIWFPELKDILKEKWDSILTIPQQFELLAELNSKLNQIRKKLEIQPPMMWCPKCQKRHRSRFSNVSITAMYYALKRFELCAEEDFKRL